MSEMDFPVPIIVEGLNFDEDTIQEITIALLVDQPEFESLDHARGWAATFGKNLRRNEHKKDRRRAEIEKLCADAIRGVFYDDNQGADPADVLEALEEMDDRMDQLSPLVRQTMVRYYVEGLTIEDIAALEWVEPDAVYKRLQRGREILKGETT